MKSERGSEREITTPMPIQRCATPPIFPVDCLVACNDNQSKSK